MKSDNRSSSFKILIQVLQVLKQVSQQKEVKKMTSITVKKKDRLIFIKLQDISHFKTDSNYVTVFSLHGQFLTEQTIVYLEGNLPDHFLRAHRGVIVNTHYVKEVQKHFNSRFVMLLNDKMQSQIVTGRSYLEAVKNWMGV